MNIKKIVMVALLFTFIAGCTPDSRTMTLLKHPIDEVRLSSFENYGGINEEYELSFEGKDELNVFEKAITTAVKQTSSHSNSEPDYDMLVEYASAEGDLQTHGIHMWLGETVKFMYIADESIYVVSPSMSEKIHALLK